MSPRLLALSVGRPREIEWDGETVLTSIFKGRAAGRRRVGATNIDGDEQSDLRVHGGPEKAVYGYPSEHYPYWRQVLDLPDLAWGAFGENLTTEGLLESTVSIGDEFKIGSVELVVSQPRMPCYKLGIRFGREDMVKRFQDSGKSGFYFAVTREGDLGEGDDITLVNRDPRGLTVSDVVRLISVDKQDRGLLERAAQHPALAAGWRESFRRRLGAMPSSHRPSRS